MPYLLMYLVPGSYAILAGSPVSGYLVLVPFTMILVQWLSHLLGFARVNWFLFQRFPDSYRVFWLQFPLWESVVLLTIFIVNIYWISRLTNYITVTGDSPLNEVHGLK